MSRPVKRRNVKSYARDIEVLGRLRTAIIMDTSLDWAESKATVDQIDVLMNCLVKLSHHVVQKTA